MSDAIKEVVNIDRVVHEPARLAILLTLKACAYADFKFLDYYVRAVRSGP